jgi:hypothetical protein
MLLHADGKYETKAGMLLIFISMKGYGCNWTWESIQFHT